MRFEHEPRADALTDHRPGFAVTTAKRLKRVRMLGAGKLVRRYELAYEAAEGMGLSRLRAVTMFGSDDQTALPPITFSYTDFQPSNELLQIMVGGPATSLEDPNTDLVDMDGDSLPDLLQATTAGHLVSPNLGAAWGPPTRMATNPSVELSSNGVEIADLDGNGLPDLVAKLAAGPGHFYYLPNLGQGRWEGRELFRNSPDFALGAGDQAPGS